MEPMTRLPCVPCPGLHRSIAVSDSALLGGVRTGASCCLEAPPRTPSRSWPPAWVTWPSGHPCSDHFVAPGPHAALSAAALPPQGCSVGPLPWSSPQTLEAPSLRGPHSRCAARPLLSLSECLSSCSTNITTAWNVPPRPHSRHLPHLLSLSHPGPSQVNAGRHCSPVSLRGLCHQAPCVLHPKNLWGPACPSLVQAAIPAPRPRPAGLSPDTARLSCPLPTAACRAPLL